MRIKLISDVSTSFTKTAKGGYSVAEVNYEGAKKPFKLVSFSNPAVFETLKNAKAGEVYEVDSVKGDDGFYKWTSAKKAEADEAAPADSKTKAWTPAADPRETKDERAARQRLIVRQSSLSNAIELLSVNRQPEDGPLVVAGVLDLANQLTAWVYEAPDLFDEPNDIPF